MPTEQIERHLSANMTWNKRQIMWANFLGGVSWGVGTAVGAGLIVAIIGGILNWFGIFDIFKQVSQAPQFYQ
ncbi:MAG: DUF5665 domain-containing protein [Candidatus Daviesbacteria bacterium]|nr:DUF5665 domain-containing protein [Candidatus Daviesbacteria bacterium]